MKYITTLFTLLFITTIAFAQTDTWKVLENVTYKSKYDKMLGIQVDVPIFGKKVKAIEGKEVTIKGYIIPLEGYKDQAYFVFSAFPYNMCFFCGGAGPETVMEVYTKQSIKYTSKIITIKGKLALNDKDANQLMYSLKNATLVEN